MGTENKLIKEIKYSEVEIQNRISNIAEKINYDFQDAKELVFLIIIKGGLNFAYDLMKKINVDISVDFISAKSYDLDLKISKPKISYQGTIDLFEKDVLLIDDIIDSGETLFSINEFLKQYRPKSISIASIISKPNPKKPSGIKIYSCWNEEPGGFLMGYGLDYDEKYRNLPYIAIISYNNK